MDVRDLLKFGGGAIKLTAEEKISFKIESQEFTVTFNSNGGIESNTTQTKLFGFPYGTLPTLTRTGYDFDGWNTASNGTGTSLDEDSLVTTQSNHSIFAQWQIITYGITYVLNSGTNNGSNPFTFNVTNLPLSLASPTRTGYNFGGWSVNPITTLQNITTSASWSAATYSVGLSKNGGSGGTDSVTATFDAAMPSATGPTRQGFTFNGYFISSTQYYTNAMASARTWNIAANSTLTASWTANTYALSFDNGGGSGTMNNQSFTAGTAFNISSNTFTRSGYSFNGWATTAGGALVYSNNQQVTLFDNLELIARWSGNPYTASFNFNGGSGLFATTEIEVFFGELVPGIFTPIRNGYEFDGYYNNGNQYYNSDGLPVRNWDIVGDATLVAQWSAIPLTVTFNANGGGTPSPTSKQVTNGSTYGTLATVSRTGHTFMGWFTTQTGGVQRTSASTVTRTTDHTLWARWTANTYNVNLNHQGGTFNINNVTATFGSPLPTLPSLPSRSGFFFGGYYAGTNSSGSRYYTNNGVGDTAWNITNNITTIYAYWIENTGGSGGGSGCLAIDTPIVMEDGTTKRVDEIYVGDRVRSYVVNGMIDESDPNWVNFTTTSTDGEYHISTVKQADRDWFSSYYKINNDIRITKQHEIFVKNNQSGVWGWIEAPNIKVGDHLFGMDGSEVEVTTILHVKERLDVITLNVEETDTYFGGNTPVLIHNRDLVKGGDF
jgi:uncharacterized repeat protein (TIGR02543 family)